MMDEREITPNVVFDCNFYLRATVTRGPAFDCLARLEEQHYTLFVCGPLLEEVKEVLSRPVLQHRFSALTPESLAQLLARLEKFAILIHNVPETFRYARDPDDEVYVNLALITNARYLVTYDKDLLDLMRETEEGRDFRHRFPHLQILGPLAFLEALDFLRDRAA
jgi:putative PIN family toxin of toxin-antitoxin system